MKCEEHVSYNEESSSTTYSPQYDLFTYLIPESEEESLYLEEDKEELPAPQLFAVEFKWKNHIVAAGKYIFFVILWTICDGRRLFTVANMFFVFHLIVGVGVGLRVVPHIE